MILTDFSKELHLRLLGNPSQRPFVCEGNPLECEIFIVGFNPATEMTRLFLDDWDDYYGFNKSKWLKHYIDERASIPLDPTKKKRNKISNSRSRIEWITETVSGTKCLETNLYSKATKTAKSLKPLDRDIEIFKFLFNSIKPKVLFLHGIEVRQEIEKIFSFKLPENIFSKCEIFEHKLTIIPKKHLSRGWSKENTINFANEINRYV